MAGFRGTVRYASVNAHKNKVHTHHLLFYFSVHPVFNTLSLRVDFISVHLYYKWTHLSITVCSLTVTQHLIIDSFKLFILCVHFHCWVNICFFTVMLNWVVNITGNGKAWWLVVSVLHGGGVLGWSAALEEDQGQGGCYIEMREQILWLKGVDCNAGVCALGASREAEGGVWPSPHAEAFALRVQHLPGPH